VTSHKDCAGDGLAQKQESTKMKNRYMFPLVILLAAAPVAAQTKIEPKEPVEPKPFPKFAEPLDQKPFLPDDLVLPKPFKLDDLSEPHKALTQAEKALKDMDLTPLKALTLGGSPKLDTLMEQAKVLSEKGAALADKSFFLEDKANLLKDHFAYSFDQDRGRDREAEMQQREREREAQWYSEGWDAAADSRYDRALAMFERVIALKLPPPSKIDAALYWKAYSQNRLGQRSEALATLALLAKTYPNSSYRKQANVLEAEVRRDIGQPVRPQDSSDDEVKLLALQALQNTDPEQAVPMIEKVLEGTSGPRVKQRALFVLAQSKAPRAREVLRNYAKGSSTPELQAQAVQYLGVHGGPENRAVLAEVYAGTADVEVKRRILRAFMVAGDKERLFKAAQSEQNPDLRGEAVNQLGNMSAHEELWQLYQKETSPDVKRRIIRSMANGGAIDRLIELSKTEQNPELRREVIRVFGQTRASRTSDALVQIYNSDSNVDVRKTVINALAQQDNATALVALARKEPDINMKKEIVGRLSQMHSKVATDYMLELLGK
jgi:HEAT repeat protein